MYLVSIYCLFGDDTGKNLSFLETNLFNRIYCLLESIYFEIAVDPYT